MGDEASPPRRIDVGVGVMTNKERGIAEARRDAVSTARRAGVRACIKAAMQERTGYVERRNVALDRADLSGADSWNSKVVAVESIISKLEALL